jgi:tetratricopeptide (TPR) repeat protein
MTIPTTRTFALLAMMLAASATHAGDLEQDIQQLKADWASALYQTADRDQKLEALEALSLRAAALTQQYPQRAEALAWDGIVICSSAGVTRGLRGLRLAEQCRDKLEAALAIDAEALDGTIYMSLGVLYHKVPRAPLGFRNDDKAREYLERAVAINPESMDANYFYAEFLFDDKQYEQARAYLLRALQASSSEDQEVADAGRRREIEALLDKVVDKVS